MTTIDEAIEKIKTTLADYCIVTHKEADDISRAAAIKILTYVAEWHEEQAGKLGAYRSMAFTAAADAHVETAAHFRALIEELRKP